MDIGGMFQQTSQDKFMSKLRTDEVNNKLKAEKRETVKEMGKDQFLKLLVTQLQHQDPTNPMQDREFIAQMAQFSSLEQMLNINTNMEKFLGNLSFQSSFDLLGKQVDIESSSMADKNGNPRLISGMVESVGKIGNDSVVTIDGVNYPASDIVKVKN